MSLLNSSGFDSDAYVLMKEYADHQIRHVDFRLVDRYKNKPIEWAETFLPLVTNLVESENFEGAKAYSDAIREFINDFLPISDKLTDEELLKLPEFKEFDIRGIVSFWDLN